MQQQESLEAAKKQVAGFLKKEVKDLNESELSIAKQMAKEADTASANTQVLRSDDDDDDSDIKAFEEGGPGSGRHPGDGKSQDKKPSVEDRQKIMDQYSSMLRSGSSRGEARKYFHSSMAKAYGAKNVDDYIVKAKQHGFTITRADEKKLRTAMKDYKEASKSIHLGFKPKFKESKASKGKRYEIVLIQEGLGNLKDAFYYSPQAIHSAVSIFEGAPIYANHPSKTEEYDQPERTVEKKVGHIENVKAVKADDNRMMCIGEAVILEGEAYDWVRTIMNHSIDYSQKYKDKDFIGFSINASGDSVEENAKDVLARAPQSAQSKVSEAISQGNEKIRVVTEITECVSCDLVTQAGAGGRVLKILEEDKMSKGKKREAFPGAEDKEKKKPEGPPQGDGGDVGAEGKPHSDEDQDKAVISDMIKKHMGDGMSDEDGANEESMNEIHENVGAYSEMGMEKEEAVKHACAEFKKNTIKGQKMKQEETSDEPEKEADMEAKKKEDTTEAGEKPPVEEKKETAATKEQNLKETESIKLIGRVAALEAELKTERLEKYVNRKLEESKVPRAATKKFMEQCKAKFANEQDFDLKFSIFTEALKEASAVTFVTSMERSTSGEAGDSLSLADCVTE